MARSRNLQFRLADLFLATFWLAVALAILRFFPQASSYPREFAVHVACVQAGLIGAVAVALGGILGIADRNLMLGLELGAALGAYLALAWWFIHIFAQMW